jgi:hypothetical protein
VTDSYVNKEYVVRLEALVEQLEAEVTRLRDDLEICIDERNGMHDAVMLKNNINAALRARINDLKGMAEEIYRFQTGCRWETTTKYEKKEYMVIARAVSAWLKEGKG